MAATSAAKVSPTRIRRRPGSWKCAACGRSRRAADRKADFADQQRFRQLAAALEPHLLAGVGALRLADLAEGPEQPGAALGQRECRAPCA